MKVCHFNPRETNYIFQIANMLSHVAYFFKVCVWEGGVGGWGWQTHPKNLTKKGKKLFFKILEIQIRLRASNLNTFNIILTAYFLIFNSISYMCPLKCVGGYMFIQFFCNLPPPFATCLILKAVNLFLRAKITVLYTWRCTPIILC